MWLQLPELPAWLHPSLRSVLRSAVIADITRRPSARQVWRRLCCAVFVVKSGELAIANEVDAGKWLALARVGVLSGDVPPPASTVSVLVRSYQQCPACLCV